MLEENTKQVVNIRRRQQRSIETRERIIAAAVKEFAECGLLGASTRLIAKSAGVDHGLITHHFGGKEGLWNTIITATLSEVMKMLHEVIDAPDAGSNADQLALYYERFIRFIAARPQFTAILSHTRATPLREPEAVWINNTIMKLVRGAQREGRHIEGNPAHLLFLFYGAAVRVHMLSTEAEQLIGQSPSSEKFVRQHIELCHKLFFRDPPAAGSKGRRAPVRSQQRRAARS